MRILEVTESFATGTMEVVRLVSEGMARAGHRVAIAYGERPETPLDLRATVDHEVELIPLPWTDRSVGAQVSSVRALRSLCRQWQPDVIHLHSSFAGFVGAISVTSCAPTIYTPHGYSMLAARSRVARAAYRFAERFIAHRVTMIGAVSESEGALARSVGARRVAVVPNGIPELEVPAAPVRNRDGRPRVVAMGRIVPARRPEGTARILADVDDVADVGWIGGPGADPGTAEVVRALGVPVSGWVDRDEAIRRLSQASVLLQWSEWDSHPLTVLEAFAADVLVVGSDIDSNRDLLGEAQVCATEGEAVALIRRMIEDPERSRALLAEQRRRRDRFSAGRMVDDWLRIYSGLTSEDGATASPGDGG